MGMGIYMCFQQCSSSFRNRGRNEVHCLVLTWVLTWATLTLSNIKFHKHSHLKGNLQSKALQWVSDSALTQILWLSDSQKEPRSPRAAFSAHPAMCSHMQGLWRNLSKVCYSGLLLTMSYLQASTTQCLHSKSLKLVRSRLKLHCTMQMLLSAEGLAHLSMNTEDHLCFMRSKFPMYECQEFSAHDNCRCLLQSCWFVLVFQTKQACCWFNSHIFMLKTIHRNKNQVFPNQGNHKWNFKDIIHSPVFEELAFPLYLLNTLW